MALHYWVIGPGVSRERRIRPLWDHSGVSKRRDQTQCDAAGYLTRTKTLKMTCLHTESLKPNFVVVGSRGELSYLAPLGSEKISAPSFKQCFFCGGGYYIAIWPCWCFHGRYYFYSLKFTLMFINERKRNANTYLISNFDSLETAPSNLPP
jgi:hypothetical protein